MARLTLEEYHAEFAKREIKTELYSGPNGQFLPLLPELLGRPLKHDEMDYNLELLDEVIKNYRVLNSNGEAAGLDQSDLGKYLKFAEVNGEPGKYVWLLDEVTGIGSAGQDGTSGTDGTSGISGTSGIDGTSGISGTDGTSGISGTDGTSGTSGLEGNLAIWKFNSSITDTTINPNPSFFSLNSGSDFGVSTESISINDIASSPAVNFATILNLLTIGTILKIIRVDDPTFFKILRIDAVLPMVDDFEDFEVFQIAGGGVGSVPNNTEFVFVITGQPGTSGTSGSSGTSGIGVPEGGTTGQFLIKLSDDDYDTGWSDLTPQLDEEGREITDDLNQNPNATTGDEAATGVFITFTPFADSNVQVLVNGLSINLADGDTERLSKPCYFSADDGVTAKNIADIEAGDELFWNGSIAKYDLDVTDDVDLLYEASNRDL